MYAEKTFEWHDFFMRSISCSPTHRAHSRAVRILSDYLLKSYNVTFGVR